jgi:hypothetical protein
MTDPSKALRDAYDTLLYQTVQYDSQDVAFYSRIPSREARRYVHYAGFIFGPSAQYCKGGNSLSGVVVLKVWTRFDGQAGGYDEVDAISSSVLQNVVVRPSPLTPVGWTVVTTVPENIGQVIPEEDEEYTWYSKELRIRHELQSS